MADLKTQFAQEFTELQTSKLPVITLYLKPLEAWVVFSQLQLALRHPQNIGPSAKIAEKVARRLQEAVATTPALAKVAEMGWDPEYVDVE